MTNNDDSSSLVSVIGNHILNPDITMPKQVEDKILKLLKDSPFDGKVKLGSACTGWVVASQAARMEPCIPHDIMFGCDNNTHVEAFARANFTILKWFQDVFEPGFIEAGHVDLFDFGAPCQPWSRANTRGHVHGADDHRAHVVVPIVKYIAANFPKFWLMEQVMTILKGPGLAFLRELIKHIHDVTYGAYDINIFTKNAKDAALPQDRSRVFMIGRPKLAVPRQINFDRCCSQTGAPANLRNIYSIGALELAKYITTGKACNNAQLGATAEKNLIEAYGMMVEAGIKPDQTPMVIDLGGSKVQLKYNSFPTMTASRCSSHAYWSTELKRYFNMEELIRGQGGCPGKLDWSMISENAMGSIVGNAIAVPVFRQFLVRIMNALWSTTVS